MTRWGETGWHAPADRPWSQLRDQAGAGQAVGCELVGAPSPVEVQVGLGADDEFRGSTPDSTQDRPIAGAERRVGGHRSHPLQLDLSEGDGVAGTDGRAGHGGHGSDELFRVEVAA